MIRRLVSWVALVLVCGAAAAAPAPEDQAVGNILRRLETSKDPADWQKGLAEVDAALAKDAKRPVSHYVRGRILSELGRREDALAAYGRAVELDPRFGDAYYNAGVVLAALGRKREAIARWDQALKVDPANADALYNSGQAAYDLKDFKLSLARFSQVAKLTPDDFDASKKVMQAQLALGQDKPAWKTRERLFALWKAGKGPGGGKATEYVLDQLDVGGHHVFVYETFAPTGDLAYVYTFKVQDDSGAKTLFTVQLETSAVIREAGVPYVMGSDTRAGHRTFNQTWKKLPAYTVVRAAAQKLITAQLAPVK